MGLGPGASCDITLNTALTPEQRGIYQDPDVIREILNHAKNIVLIGLSSDSSKASYFVASYLQSEGYHIIPVTPRAGKILGETCYPGLRDVPVPIDLVDVFRPAREVPAIVEDAIAVGAKALWTQLRIIDFEAAEKARAAGLKVVMDKCVKMEHGRYHGGLHWAGMNTEIITARRKTAV
jgi:predicted CoA-binding protein